MTWILASQSARRRHLLSLLGLEFSVFHPELSEQIDIAKLDESMRTLAVAKACDAQRRFSQGISIGCDTAVFCQGQCLGKPVNREQAGTMLRTLSGKTHSVISALALVDLAKSYCVSGLERTLVRFRVLSADDIERYLDGNEYQDKAGAYGVQDQGAVLVAQMIGCYTNVIGFPVSLFLELKREIEAALTP